MMHGPAMGCESTAHQGELERGNLLSLLCHRKPDCVCKEVWGSEINDGNGKMTLQSIAFGQQLGASKDEENLEKENW